MTTLHIDVKGVPELVSDLNGLSDDLEDLPTMDEMSKQMATIGSSLAPRRTGNLASSVKPLRSTKNNNAGAIALAPYAAVINYGSIRRGIEATHFMNHIDPIVEPDLHKLVEKGVDILIDERGLG